MTTVKVCREVADRIELKAKPGESKDKTLRRLLLGERPAVRSTNRDSKIIIVKVSRGMRTHIRRKAFPKETVAATLLRLMGGERI